MHVPRLLLTVLYLPCVRCNVLVSCIYWQNIPTPNPIDSLPPQPNAPNPPPTIIHLETTVLLVFQEIGWGGEEGLLHCLSWPKVKTKHRIQSLDPVSAQLKVDLKGV